MAPGGKALEFPLEIPFFKLDVDKFAARVIKAHANFTLA